MQVYTYEIEYTMNNALRNLYLLGDIHLGTIHCAENLLDEQIREIDNDPLALVLLMGDYGEFITPRDPRFDPDMRSIAPWLRNDLDDIAMTQVEKIVEFLDPIRHKIVGALRGNHEDSIRTHSHTNVMKHICKALNTEHLGYSSFVNFRFKRQHSTEVHVIRGAFTHGASGAFTHQGKINALVKFMRDFDAMIYGYAHVHDIDQVRKPCMTLDRSNNILNKESIGVLTGSWFRTYTQGITASYGEKKLFPPNTIGCPVVKIHPTKRITAIT